VIESGKTPKHWVKAEIDKEVATLKAEGWKAHAAHSMGGVRDPFGHPLVWVRSLIERGRCGRVPAVRT